MREEMVGFFGKGKFEANLNGIGEVSMCGVRGIIAGAQEIERAREDVAVLMKYMWTSVVIEFESVNSTTLLIKFRFSMIEVCVVVVYVSTKGKDEEREGF